MRVDDDVLAVLSRADTLKRSLLSFAVAVPWLAGIVLANGFWCTVAAILFPPFGWYLVVERAMAMAGWVSC